MNKEETFQKLTKLFATKINYSGEFNSLFFIEKEHGKTKINFLNKQHYDFIHKHLIKDVLEVVGSYVTLGFLNLKTDDLTLKNEPQIENKIVVKPVKIKQKEKVELPTIRNKTIKQIENFMFSEYKEIIEEQKKIRQQKENYLDDITYSWHYGKITFIAKLNSYLDKIKDYEED